MSNLASENVAVTGSGFLFQFILDSCVHDGKKKIGFNKKINISIYFGDVDDEKDHCKDLEIGKPRTCQIAEIISYKKTGKQYIDTEADPNEQRLSNNK